MNPFDFRNPRLTLSHRPGRGPDSGWWITGLPFADWPEAGPYPNRAEAESDRLGLQRDYVAGADFYEREAAADPTCLASHPCHKKEKKEKMAMAMANEKMAAAATGQVSQPRQKELFVDALTLADAAFDVAALLK